MTSQPETTGSCPFPHEALAAAQAAQTAQAAGCPAAPARRSFLGAALGVGAAGAALAGGAFAFAGAGKAVAAETSGTVPFHGEHQAGILTPQPTSAMFISFDVIAADRKALEDLFHTLTDRIRFLTAGGTRPTSASARRRPTTGSSARPCPLTTSR